MKLIAESGSTRTEWSLVDGTNLIERVFTEGLNPFFQTRREISRSVRLGLPESFFKRKLEQVYFYGAGCSNHEKKNIMGASLVAQFKTPIQVESDLLAAARGLFIDTPGIACILGTGSNSCFYDGRIIVRNVRSGGYILGDEGSGADLGKSFLADLLKGLTPVELSEAFFSKFRITPDDVMDSVYNRPFPNRFLATLSYFLADHQGHDYVDTLLRDGCRKFFRRCVCQYDYQNYPVRIVGSVASRYSDILREIATEFSVTLDVIEETPMNGLIIYHTATEREELNELN
jgi:N-acetylglucosamine kinase-like BadF-type ATPase